MNPEAHLPEISNGKSRPMPSVFNPRRISSNGPQDPSARRQPSLRDAVCENPALSGQQKATHNVLSSSDSPSLQVPLTLHRRSSFIPGVATRSLRKVQSQSTTRPITFQSDRDYYSPTYSEESPLTPLEAPEAGGVWTTPAPVARTETPLNIDYTHLGGLRLGSLRVMNGIASPAPTEVSKNIKRYSVPLSRCDTSSNYGDDENDPNEVPRGRRRYSFDSVDEQLLMVEVRRKPVPAPFSRNDIQLPKRSGLHHSGTQTANASRTERLILGAGSTRQPGAPLVDRTSIIAQEYIAELSGSPYQTQRSFSATGSVLKCTSKATEFDDQLFESDCENESCDKKRRVDTSSSDGSDYGTSDTHYTVSDATSSREEALYSRLQQPSKQPSRPSLKPVSSGQSLMKSDSGYNSYVSVKSPHLGVPPRVGCDGANDMPDSTAASPAMPLSENPRRSSFRPSSPSNLQEARSNTSSAISSFSRLFRSKASKPAGPSASQESAPAKPRKLQKRRPLSMPPPLGHIAVQVHPEIQEDNFPPVWPGARAKLALRNEQVSDLEHPYYRSQDAQNLRSSFLELTRRPGGMSQTDVPGMANESDARAIVQRFDETVPSVSENSYGLVYRTSRLSSARESARAFEFRGRNSAYELPRYPRSTMDDKLAAGFAPGVSELSSPSNQRLVSFNDRGGIPGRNLRPLSIATDAPPLPPLPTPEHIRQCELVREQPYKRECDPTLPTYDLSRSRPKSWMPGGAPGPFITQDESYRPPSDWLESDLAPPPPPRRAAPPPPPSPRPGFFELSGESVAPPPPSHSPQPTTVEPEEENPWTKQARLWRANRKSVAEMLQPKSEPQALYPDISPSSATRSPEGYIHQSQGYFVEESSHSALRPSFHHPPKELSTSRPPPRLSPANSHYGWSTSLAGELHPLELPRMAPSPRFGRYSAGLNYAYDREAGFGGSAGTRSVSGKAEGEKKCTALSETCGIDLSDVPVMG